MTPEEKRKAARQYILWAYRKLGLTANVDVPSIEAAIDALVAYLQQPGVQTAINDELPEPYKSDAVQAEKAVALAVAALFLGTLLPS